MRRARIWLLGIAGLLAPGMLPAQDGASRFDWAEYHRRNDIMWEVGRRARAVYPHRRDEPLRDQNITDGEIREIEELVKEYLPRTIVNIGPVVMGCPCEEGEACTDQVWLQANTAANSVGLLLSRTQNRWDVSAVQKWWLRWRALQAEESRLGWQEFEDRRWALFQDFPVCTERSPTADNVAAQTTAEPRK